MHDYLRLRDARDSQEHFGYGFLMSMPIMPIVALQSARAGEMSHSLEEGFRLQTPPWSWSGGVV